MTKKSTTRQLEAALDDLGMGYPAHLRSAAEQQAISRVALATELHPNRDDHPRASGSIRPLIEDLLAYCALHGIDLAESVKIVKFARDRHASRGGLGR